jgi:hypothetical protein
MTHRLSEGISMIVKDLVRPTASGTKSFMIMMAAKENARPRLAPGVRALPGGSCER